MQFPDLRNQQDPTTLPTNFVDSLFENLQTVVDAHITQYQREMEALQTRVMRLERLSHRGPAE